ncbi:MAG: hypothetical protein K5829_01905 [Treponema sp.]|nr:hypothetical protein [Treponema sp.]
MKKFKVIFAFLVFFLSSFVYAQNSKLDEINRKTAERCLKIAENLILSDDWNGALAQAEMGLAYDDSVSDLLYVKAMAQEKLGYSKLKILESIKAAFEKDIWINYNKNGARILYADLLCDTGLYEESLSLLNDEGFIYSADAEFIRIKDFYRLGTADSIGQARDKINTTRKIYPSDSRFPELFFSFEYSFMLQAKNDGIDYFIPEIVKMIADSYIVTFPLDEADVSEMELLSTFFASDEKKTRLIKALEAKNADTPLFALAALSADVISQTKAYDIFINWLDGDISLSILSSFVSLLTDEALIQDMNIRLNAFEGTLCIDDNLDLQNELTVKYSRGRAQYIYYDKNMDGEKDLYSVCDFGVPLYSSFDHGLTEIFYDMYPNVSCINKNKENAVYYFLNDDYVFAPFDMIIYPAFSRLGTSFYIPYVNPELMAPDKVELIKNTSCVELNAKENGSSKVVYTYFGGNPVFANFTDNAGKFAFASLENGFPFVRFVDYDRDGNFETSETYDIDFDNSHADESERKVIENIFGAIPFAEKLYLNKIEIDRNNDTVVEFKEEYPGNGNIISSWDNDGNGIWECEYFKFVDSDMEEIYFYKDNGLPKVILTKISGIPSKIKVGNLEVPLIKGSQDYIYWLQNKGSWANENAIMKEARGLASGVVCIVQNDEKRFSVIRIDDVYYCRELPESYIPDDDEDTVQ